MRVRGAFTLIELCVTLAVGGLVLLLVVTLGVREQHTHENIGRLLSALTPLREGASILPVDLRALGPAAGDIVAASDTTLDIQSTIGGGVVCTFERTLSGMVSSLTLVPHTARNGELSSSSSLPQFGDSIRVLSTGAGAEQWASAAVRAASLVPGACGMAQEFPLDAAERAERSLVVSLVDSIPASAVSGGSPVRLTRRERYSFYRASDGAWYLGLREWNAGTARFDVVQPLAGPFASPLSGGARFRYLDSLGSQLSSIDQPRDIRALAIDLVASVPSTIRGSAHRGIAEPLRRESTTVVVTPRNTPR